MILKLTLLNLTLVLWLISMVIAELILSFKLKKGLNFGKRLILNNTVWSKFKNLEELPQLTLLILVYFLIWNIWDFIVFFRFWWKCWLSGSSLKLSSNILLNCHSLQLEHCLLFKFVFQIFEISLWKHFSRRTSIFNSISA